MSNFLADILASTRLRISCAKQERTQEELELLIRRGTLVSTEPASALSNKARGATGSVEVALRPFAAALSTPGLSFICEVKQASPSKGQISEEATFDYLGIARDYQAAGAAAVSVLTEPQFFKGHNRHLFDIAEAVSIPALRKDFVIDEYQVYEARALGAAAILLIVAALDDATLMQFLQRAGELGMDVLVEVHNEEELKRALACGAKIIGINNRDLVSFQVDLATTERLRPLVPKELIVVAESGVRDAGDVRRMTAAGVDAVLIGESLVRAVDRQAALKELQAAASLGSLGAR